MDMIPNPSCGWQAKMLKLELKWPTNKLWELSELSMEIQRLPVRWLLNIRCNNTGRLHCYVFCIGLLINIRNTNQLSWAIKYPTPPGVHLPILEAQWTLWNTIYAWTMNKTILLNKFWFRPMEAPGGSPQRKFFVTGFPESFPNLDFCRRPQHLPSWSPSLHSCCQQPDWLDR